MNYIGLFLRGLAMGCADVVPGVSGGTIAFITGIYTQLIDSLKSINLAALKTLFSQGPVAAWQQINGNFLLAVFGGALIALLSLAKVITYLLATYPIFLWSFFFGLILAASWHMLKQIPQWSLARGGALLLGAVITAFISMAGPSEVELTPITLLIGGSIAICAMILPGISGSFLLLLMGMYTPVLTALKGFELSVITWFAAGAAVGLLAFSRLLSWLLHRFQYLMYALLTGFMIGALIKVWPWKKVLSYRQNSHGEQVPFLEQAILPQAEDISVLVGALAAAVVGISVVLLMERIADGQQKPHDG